MNLCTIVYVCVYVHVLLQNTYAISFVICNWLEWEQHLCQPDLTLQLVQYELKQVLPNIVVASSTTYMTSCSLKKKKKKKNEFKTSRTFFSDLFWIFFVLNSFIFLCSMNFWNAAWEEEEPVWKTNKGTIMSRIYGVIIVWLPWNE